MMDDSDTFDELVLAVRAGFSDDFSDSVFMAAPGGACSLYFKGTVPSGVASLITASGLTVNTYGNVGKNGLEWIQQVEGITNYLLEEEYTDFVVAFDSIDNIDVVIGADQDAPTLPQELAGNVTITEVSGSVMQPYAVVWGGSAMRVSGDFECSSSWNVVHTTTGVTGTVTAGHCDNGTNQVLDSTGAVVTATFQAEHRGRHGDFQWHTTPELEPPIFRYDSEPDDHRAVVSVKTTWSRNQWSCNYGQVTDDRYCDQIYRTSIASRDPDGNLLRHQVVMDGLGAQPGDSGGGWSFHNEAHGVCTGAVTMYGVERDLLSKAERLDNALDVEVRIAE